MSSPTSRSLRYSHGFLISMSNGEFFYVPNKLNQELFKYNARSDEWIRLLASIGDQNDRIDDAVFDEERRTLFLWTRNAVLTVNVGTNNIQIIRGEPPQHVLPEFKILTPGQLHAFSLFVPRRMRRGQIAHLIFDKPSGKAILNNIVNIPKIMLLYQAQFIKSRNSILLAHDGGYNMIPRKNLRFSEYSLSTNQWVSWKWIGSLVFKKRSARCFIITQDERYLIIKGFWTGSGLAYVCDIESQRVSAISTDLPGGYNPHHFTWRDDMKDELLTFGFVRETFKSSEFHTLQALPACLVEMIGKWVWNEYLHAIFTEHQPEPTRKVDIRELWKINIDSILQNLN